MTDRACPPDSNTCSAVAVINAVALTATHDGEAALVLELVYPGGGRGRVQLGSMATASIMTNCALSDVRELVGHPWTVAFTAWAE